MKEKNRDLNDMVNDKPEKEPILCINCGFDKNRPRGHIFLSDKYFIFEHTMIETARCSECGHVRDWIETGNNPKTARIIYRNFDGSKKYFEKVKIDVKKQGYLILKNDSLGDTLEDMFIQNPEPSQEKHGLKLLKAEKVDTPERFAELMKMTNEDLKNSLKDGRIPEVECPDCGKKIKAEIVVGMKIEKKLAGGYDVKVVKDSITPIEECSCKIPTDYSKRKLMEDVYGTITKKRLSEIKKLGFVFGSEMHDEHDIFNAMTDIKAVIMNIVDDVVKLKDLQFKAMMDRRIAELEKESHEAGVKGTDTEIIEDIVTENEIRIEELKKLKEVV